MSRSELVITSLTHDFSQKKSYVGFVWSDDPGKRLGLEVPFGTPVEKADEMAKKAIADFAVEMAECSITRA